jgi:hypothetical protein
LKVRKAYNRRKLRVHYLEELKQLSKQLLAVKKTRQEAFLKSTLSNEGKCWTEFYKYVKRRKGKRENIPDIKDCNGRIMTDSREKANCLNFYNSPVFTGEGKIPNIQGENSGEPAPLILKSLGKELQRSGKTNR